MANLHLVTGYAGQEHVTADDQGAFNAATMGTGQHVINTGNLFAASIISNNQVKVLDGDIYMNGRYIRLNPGTVVDLTIENGTQGYFRNDLIVARYTKNTSTGVEEANLVVIKGMPSENPVDPEHITGNILDGAVECDFPLYRVSIDGITVTGLEALFTAKDFVIGNTVTPISKGGTGATTAAEARKNLGAASTISVNVDVGTDWTADETNGGFVQTVSVSGILASDNPTVDIVLGADIEANALYKAAWSMIDRITTAAGSITLYANEYAPATAFTIQMKVVR